MTNPEQFNDGSNLPIESNDDALLRMLSGANFGPGVKITLPSGKELNGDEAQAFTSAFSDRVHEADGTHEPAGRNVNSYEATLPTIVRGIDKDDNPLDSRFDDWTGDPTTDRARLVARARAAAVWSNSESKEEQSRNTEPQQVEKTLKRKWWKGNR